MIHGAAAAFHATEVLDVKIASEQGRNEPLEDQGGRNTVHSGGGGGSGHLRGFLGAKHGVGLTGKALDPHHPKMS